MALPRYRQLKLKVSDLIMDIYVEAAREELGPFKDARRFTQHEGTNLRHNTLDNSQKQKQIDYQEFATDYIVKYEEVPKQGPMDIIQLMREKGKEFGAEQAKHNYKVIAAATEEVGNVVNNGNQPFSAESYLEVMDKIQMDFDEEGRPVWPTMVVGEENFEKAKAVVQEVESNPETRKKIDEMIARKKEEHDADQARRKLVD